MPPEAGVVFILILSVLTVTIATLYLRHRTQQMLHQERMTAIEKGTAVPPAPMGKPWSTRVYLLRGLIWSFTGAALIVCLLGVAWSDRRPESAESMAWSAKHVSETLDISMEQARQIVEKDQATHAHGMPPALSLLGLIPFSIGLAYLVFYYSDPSRKLPPSENQL